MSEPVNRTTDELASLLKISPRTLIRWRHEGTGPTYVRLGRRILYPGVETDKWLRKNQVVPVREQQ